MSILTLLGTYASLTNSEHEDNFYKVTDQEISSINFRYLKEIKSKIFLFVIRIFK
jgi:hypothetical protein